jgi:drug/metabolite transporter (DMT)-like permease
VAIPVVACVGFLLLGLLLAALVGPDSGVLPVSAAVALVAVVVFCARCFRGPNESDAPRPWWKMTGAPVWAFTFAALFLVSPLNRLGTPTGADVVSTTASVVVAIAFLASGIVQTRQERTGRSPRA